VTVGAPLTIRTGKCVVIFFGTGIFVLSCANLTALDSILFDAVIITVVHDIFKDISLDSLKNNMAENPVLVDVRGFFRNANDHGFNYQTL